MSTSRHGYEFAAAPHSPEAVIADMRTRSMYGAAVWDTVVAAGLVDPTQLQLDPLHWASRNFSEDDFVLGVRPMDPAWRQQLVFDSEYGPQPDDDPAYRLLHEAMHPYLWMIQDTPAGEALSHFAKTAREQSLSGRGLTALGSWSHYQGRKKLTEDCTELLTMFAWHPNYAQTFTRFLADPGHRETRQSVGLVRLGASNADKLFKIVGDALVTTLPSSLRR